MGKLFKFIRHPVSVTKTRLAAFWAPYKYKSWRPDGYDASRYWRDRFAKYELDLRGAGNNGLTHQENEKMYRSASKVLSDCLEREQVNLKTAEVLDIGCGTSYYAENLSKLGMSHYTGVDITDVLFPSLQTKFPRFKFQKLDVCIEQLSGSYDLIMMIDVTQHITNQEKFAFAMKNLREHLNPGGIIILTFWPHSKGKLFYGAAWNLFDYQENFPGFAVSEPVKFRDKYLISLR